MKNFITIIISIMTLSATSSFAASLAKTSQVICGTGCGINLGYALMSATNALNEEIPVEDKVIDSTKNDKDEDLTRTIVKGPISVSKPSEPVVDRTPTQCGHQTFPIVAGVCVTATYNTVILNCTTKYNQDTGEPVTTCK